MVVFVFVPFQQQRQHRMEIIRVGAIIVNKRGKTM